MKKTALAAAMALSMGTGLAQAASITVTKLLFYTKSGKSSTGLGGLNTTVSGTVNDAGTGSYNSGTTAFFGSHWTATQVAWFDTHSSTATWSGTAGQGAFSYTFHLTGNQVAAGVIFDWGTTTGIPVLAAFDCPAGAGACTPVDTDGDGWGGTAMVTTPFAGQTATFFGTTPGYLPGFGWQRGAGTGSRLALRLRFGRSGWRGTPPEKT